MRNPEISDWIPAFVAMTEKGNPLRAPCKRIVAQMEPKGKRKSFYICAKISQNFDFTTEYGTKTLSVFAKFSEFL
jgi:hypothetical protein